MNKFFKNSIVALIISGMVVVPYLSLIPTAEAQYQSGPNAQYSYQNFGSGGGGIDGYLTGLTPVILKLPQCQKVIGKGVTGLFGFFKKQFQSDATNAAQTQQKLQDTAVAAASTVAGVPVYLPATTEQKIDKILVNSLGTVNNTDALVKNDTCLNAIGRAVTKLMLQKLTVATVDWINTGRFGNSFYIKSSGDTFWNIAKNEVLGFGLEIKDPKNFPFSKAFMQAQALTLQNHFAQNARYSLNEMIGATNPNCRDSMGHPTGCDIAFKANFNAGGWSAWDALTQVPANNPIGFNLMASSELNQRLAGTSQSTAQNIRDELQQAAGYLGQNRCTMQESHAIITHADGTTSNGPSVYTKNNDITPQEEAAYNNGVTNYNNTGLPPRHCVAHEYVTPGNMIADAATKLSHYPDNQYLKASDLNDAIAAIADAFINKKYSELLSKKGFAGVSTTGGDGSFQYDMENGSSSISNASQVSQDFPNYITSSWLTQNPDFNIRTDLSQALIDTQRTDMQKLTDENKVLNDLNRTIYQLDYCIPGPHPGWESDARDALDQVESTVVAKTKDDLSDGDNSNVVNIAGAGVSTALSIALKSVKLVPIIGTAVSFAASLAGSLGLFNGDDKLNDYYSAYLFAFTGIQTDATSNVLHSPDDINHGLDVMLERYIEKVHQYFSNPDWLPRVTPEANQEFLKTKGYTQMISDNSTEISALKGVVTQLAAIKDGVDNLNNQLSAGSLTQDQYENSLKPLINQFGRLSNNMVSGDDVATVDSLMKQEKDEIKYVYEDLLTGPAGCEVDIGAHKDKYANADYSRTIPHWQLQGRRRANYPYPIWYDYNDYGPGLEGFGAPLVQYPVPAGLASYISVPQGSGNWVRGYHAHGGGAPGFLSDAVDFDYSNAWCSDLFNGNPNLLDCIPIHDLFKHVDQKGYFVGTRIFNYPITDSSQLDTWDQPMSFEQTIGVY